MSKIEEASLLASYVQLILFAKELGIEKIPRIQTTTMLEMSKGARYIKSLLEQIFEKKYHVEVTVEQERRHLRNQRRFYITTKTLLSETSPFFNYAMDAEVYWKPHKLPALSMQTVALRLAANKLLAKAKELNQTKIRYITYMYWEPGKSIVDILDKIDQALLLMKEVEVLYQETVFLRVMTNELLRRQNGA